MFFTGSELIRFAKPDDAGAMLEIYAPYVRKTVISFEYEAPSLEEFRARMRDYMARYPWLVCERDGGLLGYAYGSPYHARAAYGWAADSSIYLREDCRGNGLGPRLYAALLECLAAQNFYVDCALISASNEASVRFHEKFGFREAGRLKDIGYKFGAWQDVVILEKALREPEVPPRPVLPIEKIGFDGLHSYIIGEDE